MSDSNSAAMAVIGLTEEEVQRFVQTRKVRGKRDSRVCVCGHAAGAHYASDGSLSPLDSLGENEVHCQAGKTPCECRTFKWVLTISDVRSFIQKTEGPGMDHALAKGLASSAARGHFPEWREGLRCFWCKKEPSEVGRLFPIAYNERGGEAMRPTADNRLHCEGCRERILSGDFSVPE